MTEQTGPAEQPTLTRAAAGDIRTVAKGGAVQVAGQITQRSLSFFFTVLATAFLAPALFGIYRGVAQVLAIAGQVGLAGFNYASMRWITRARAAGTPGGVRGAARVGLFGAGVASLLVLVILVLVAPLLAQVFGRRQDPSELAALYRVGAAYVPLFALMQVLRYCTQGYKTMVPSVVAGNIVQPAARFLLAAGALVAGFAVTGLVVSLVLSVAVGALLAGVWFWRMIGDDERRAVATADVGAMVRFAFPQAGASLLGVQTLGLGIILLDALSSDRNVGLFAVALSLQGPATVFLGGIVNIWAPVVSDLHGRGEIERLQSLYQTINRWIATFSFPVFAALIFEADAFLSLFFPRFTGAEAAVILLALGNLFYTGTGPTGYVLSMTGRPGVNFANSAAGVVLYIGLGLVFVPRYGLIGMAAVDAVVTALVNSARVIEAKILVGVQPFGRTFVKPVIATLAGAAVLLLVKLLPGADSLPVEIAGIVVAALVYLAVLKALGIDPEERYVFDRIRKRAFKGKKR